MSRILKKHWFLLGLVVVFVVTLADTTETVPGLGIWLKDRHGPDAVIFFIFLFSGLILDAGQIKSGLADTKLILTALLMIFVAAPLIGALFSLVPMSPGMKIGIFLVAVMPTTLSSGVVMTGAARGNMAQALVITLLANGLCIFTIPITLSPLLSLAGDSTLVIIDKPVIMIKIGMVVLLPLFTGLVLKAFVFSRFKGDTFGQGFQALNQCLVLAIVWMAMAQAKTVIINSAGLITGIFLVVFIFHAVLLACGYFFIKIFKFGKGSRESLIFMGGQKTLPLSLILQVTLFPQYGTAVVVCVLHHMVHLLMDGYLVGRMKEASELEY